MNKKRCHTLLPLVQLLPAVAAAAAVLFALPRTVPVLAAVPERLTTVVEQPVEAQSWEVDAVSGAPLTAEGQISAGGIGHCARACGCRYWQRRRSSSCWAAGWVSAGLSEPKKEAAARYLCSSLLFGWDDLSFLQGRLLLQQVCHAVQADAKGGKVMQHGAGSRGQDAQCAQKDER